MIVAHKIALDPNVALNNIKDEQFPGMPEVTKNAPQQAVNNLGFAFKNFFADLKKPKLSGDSTIRGCKRRANTMVSGPTTARIRIIPMPSR
jgi:transposase